MDLGVIFDQFLSFYYIFILVLFAGLHTCVDCGSGPEDVGHEHKLMNIQEKY